MRVGRRGLKRGQQTFAWRLRVWSKQTTANRGEKGVPTHSEEVGAQLLSPTYLRSLFADIVHYPAYCILRNSVFCGICNGIGILRNYSDIFCILRKKWSCILRNIRRKICILRILFTFIVQKIKVYSCIERNLYFAKLSVGDPVICEILFSLYLYFAENKIDKVVFWEKNCRNESKK